MPKKSKAQKYFDVNTKQAPQISSCQSYSSADGIVLRPAKPVVTNVPVYNPDDPLTQIEEVTDRIGSLVTNYELKAEEERFKMLNDLDVNFHISKYEPAEILSESKNVVENLISQNKELKETQFNMLGSLSTWFNREEKSLGDAEEYLRSMSNDPIPMSSTSEDLVSLLNSKGGNSQEKINKAIAIHSDIVAKAFLKIHQLERASTQQSDLIKQLQKQLESPTKRIMGRKPGIHTMPGDDIQQKFEESQTRVFFQEEQIRKLNSRIEQLIAESINSGTPKDNSAMEADLMRIKESMDYQIQIEHLRMDLNNTNDELFRVRHDLQRCLADRAFLKSQNFSLSERMSIDKSKFESLLKKMEQQSKQTSKSNTEEIALKARVAELEKEVLNLEDKMLLEQNRAHEENQRSILALRREYEMREIEIKKRQISNAIAQAQDKMFAEIQTHHENEIKMTRLQYEDQVDRLEKDFEDKKRKLEEKFQQRLNELTKQLSDKLSELDIEKQFSKQLEEEKERSKEKEMDLKTYFTQKMDQAREDFQRHISKLEIELDSRNAQIDKMAEYNEFQLKEMLSLSEIPTLVVDIEEISSESSIISIGLDHDVEIPLHLKNRFDEAIIEIKSMMEKKNLAKLNQQKESIEAYWKGVVDKEKESSEVLQSEIDSMKEQILDLTSLLSSNEKEEMFNDQINMLKNQIVELSNKSEWLESQKMKLEVEMDILRQTIDGFKNSDSSLSNEFANSFTKQSEELNQAKIDLEKMKSRYESLSSLRFAEELSHQSLIKSMKINANQYIYSQAPATQTNKLQTSPRRIIFTPLFSIRYEKDKLKESFSGLNTERKEKYISLHVSNSYNVNIIDSDDSNNNLIHHRINERSSGFFTKEQIYISEFIYCFEKILDYSVCQISKSNYASFNNNIKKSVFSSTSIHIELESPILSMKSQIIGVINPKLARLGKFLSAPISINIKQHELFGQSEEFHERRESNNALCQIAIQHNTTHPIIDLDIIKPFILIDISSNEIPNNIQDTIIPLNNHSEYSSIVKHILTKNGDLVDIPPISDVNEHTNPVAVITIAKDTIDQTKNLANKLGLVISEMQSINQESNQLRKIEMQKTIGVSLEIQKDSLVSEMREKISEIEQMIEKTTKSTQNKNMESLRISNISNISVNDESSHNFCSINTTPMEGFRNKWPDSISESTQVSISESIDVPKQKIFVERKPLTSFTFSKPIMFESKLLFQTFSRETQKVFSYGHKRQEKFTQSIKFDEKPQTPQRTLINQPNLGLSKVTEYNSVSFIDHSLSKYTSENISLIPKILISKSDMGINHEDGNKLRKININSIPVAKRIKKNDIVSNEGFTIDSSIKSIDPKISELQDQRNQISLLKKQLLQLQLTSPVNAPQVMNHVSETLNSVSEQINSIVEPTVQIISNNESFSGKLNEMLGEDPAPTNRISDKISETSGSIRLALETTQSIANLLLSRAKSQVVLQEDLSQKMDQTASDFLKKMGADKITDTTQQSELIRKMNGIANDFANSVSLMSKEINNDSQLKEALHLAQTELLKQEKLIEQLQDENRLLKFSSVHSRIASQFRDVCNELDQMLLGNTVSNKIIKSTNDATKVINAVCKLALKDKDIAKVDATGIVQRVQLNISEKNPPYSIILDDMKSILSLLHERSASKKSKELLSQLTNEIKQKKQEIQKLISNTTLAERDLAILRSQVETERIQNQKLVNTLNDQCAMLERQMKALNGQQSEELLTAQKMEATHLKDLQKSQEDLSRITKENDVLRQEIIKAKDRFDTLFSQASDAQTNNQSLKGKVQEILAESEINKMRYKEMESLKNEANKSLDEVSSQLAEALLKIESNETSLLSQKDQIEQLRQELLDNQAINMAQYVGKTDVNASKLVRAFQQRIDQYQSQIQQKSSDLVQLKSRRAQDQREMVMLKREYQRREHDLRIQILRQESIRLENESLHKAIANRDETIRLLKREINRLRELLKLQDPLKQQIRHFEKMKIDTEFELVSEKNQAQKIKNQAEQFASGTSAATYFDNLLRRHQDTIAKLEKKRREVMEVEEKGRIETMKAVSHIVKESEISIPEEIVFNMMPKPSLPKKVVLQKALNEIRNEKPVITENDIEQPKNLPQNMSYAETLKMIGELSGSVEPKKMQNLLRDARHNRIILPARNTTSSQYNGIPSSRSHQPPSLSIRRIKK